MFGVAFEGDGLVDTVGTRVRGCWKRNKEKNNGVQEQDQGGGRGRRHVRPLGPKGQTRDGAIFAALWPEHIVRKSSLEM